MAADINTLSINNKLVSWSHTRLTIDGDRFTGFTSIAWDEKREDAIGYGATKDHAPIGYSDGKYTPGEIKIKGPVHAIAQLRDWWAAKAADARSYGDVILPNMNMQWDLGEGQPEQTVEWRDLRWASNNNSNDESADPREEEITIKFLKCKRNGKTLYNSSEETG